MTRVSLFLAACCAVLLALALPVSCSAAPKGCGPATCDGCCDSTGACQFGNSQPACGGQGGQCRSCLQSESCIGGLCLLPNIGTPSCEESCDGCCRDKVCKSGSDSAACGVLGAACATCTGNQACNSDGRCQNTACLGCIDGTGACQSGQSTSACGAQGYSCVTCATGASCNSSGLCVGGSCDGCRDAQGVCRAGTTRSNCGPSGGSCVVCGANQQCNSAGQCVAVAQNDAGTGSCSAASCPDGCCAGSSCITRTSASQCGSGGAACVACAMNQQCNGNGACQNTSTGSCTAANCSSGCCSGNTCVSPPTRAQCGKGGATCSACGLTQSCSSTGRCSSCTGCSDQLTGTCRAGTDPSACGKGGATCTACPTGNSCGSGVCTPGGTGGGAGGGSGGGGGSDGGALSFDCAIDGGVPHCAAGSCCGSLAGISLCVLSGTDFILGTACGISGFCAICSTATSCGSDGQCH